MKRIISLYERTVDGLAPFGGIGPLLARASVGGMFLATGWGKLHSLGAVTEFFQELGIPAAAFHAHLVATTEFAGGIALLVGLGTRVASVPLAITMAVAIVTARLGDVEGVLGFLALEEVTYLALLVWLALTGGGAFSLDALIRRRAGTAPETEPHAAAIDDAAGDLATEH